jgi:hypothetical protein
MAERSFALGGRLTRRTYPDSSAIDRTVLAAEAQYDAASLSGASLHLYHRSQRRTIRDPSTRPSAWLHWSELDGTLPVGDSRLVLAFRQEIWRYDQQLAAFFDSWRTSGTLSYQWGDLLAVVWQVGLAAERLAAGQDCPETYNQAGIRIGAESVGHRLSCLLTAEYGWRDHTFELSGLTTSTDLAAGDVFYANSDFNYWEVWLMANWSIWRSLSWDVMANYQPENHTEKSDDSSVAFASTRLVWRW